MKSKGFINPTPQQKAIRDAGRMQTLRRAIAKAEANGNTEKVEALKAEADMRMKRLMEFNKKLAEEAKG